MIAKLKRSKKLIIVNHPREALLGASGLLENSTILLVLDSDEPEFVKWKRWLMGVCKNKFIPLYHCGISSDILRTLPPHKLKSCIASAAVGDFDYVIYAKDSRTESVIKEQWTPGNTNIKGLFSFKLDTLGSVIVPSNPEIINSYFGFAKPLFNAIKEYRAYIGKLYGFQYGDSYNVEYLRF